MNKEFKINKCEFESIQLTNCNIAVFCALSTLFLATGLNSVDGLDDVVMAALFAIFAWNNAMKRKQIIKDIFGNDLSHMFF